MGRELQARIDEALAQRPDLRQFVEKLQANVTEAEAEPAAEPPEELPSAEAVLRDLEQYLRQLQEPDEE